MIARSKRLHLCILFTATIAALIFTPRPAHAWNLANYDIDTLSVKSPDIIEVEILAAAPAPSEILRVKVITVYKGELKANEQISLRQMGYYRKHDGPTPDAKPVDWTAGERLVVFLEAGFDQETQAYTVQMSGVRLFEGGRVFEFREQGLPFHAVAMNWSKDKGKSLSFVDFNKSLTQSITATNQFLNDIDDKKAENDLEWYFDTIQHGLIGSASRGVALDSEHMRWMLCMKLAQTKDVDILGRALLLPEATDHARGYLAYGLATPKGRDFLIERIADEKLPMASRRVFAEVIGIVDPHYMSEDSAGANNLWYMTRIAELAYEMRKHDQLRDILVNHIGQITHHLRMHEDKLEPGMKTDLLAAYTYLKRLYDSTSSQSCKYLIEVAMRRGDAESYNSLHSSCGPVISLICLVFPDSTSPKNEVRVGYENVCFTDKDDVMTMAVVLEHVKTKATIAVAKDTFQGGEGTSTVPAIVTLPSDLAHGTYRIYLEIRRDGAVISKGHYLEVEL